MVRQIKRKIQFYDMVTSYAIQSAVSVKQALLEHKCAHTFCAALAWLRCGDQTKGSTGVGRFLLGPPRFLAPGVYILCDPHPLGGTVNTIDFTLSI